MTFASIFPVRSLTAKLILLTIFFVFVAEIVVMIPSVSKHRMDWFNQRIETAYLVSVALEGPRGKLINEDDARMLFDTADIRGVTVKRGDMRLLILSPEIDPHGSEDMHRVDTMNYAPHTLITNAWATIFSRGEALIQVSGRPRGADTETLDIIVSQAELRKDLLVYARNILGLSLVISTMTAVLLFYALNRIIVQPVQRLTKDMRAFEADPDRAAHIHIPSGRDDEIGAAERTLSKMQRAIHDLLVERRRLAALGSGIAKISHDLRNILASAQLMSDRLSKSDDPRVRKLSPRLIGALDRAVALSRDTLAFGRMEPGILKKENINIAELAQEVLDDTPSPIVKTENKAPADLVIEADKAQLYRSLFNLTRNASEAMAPPDTEEPSEPSTEQAPVIRIGAEQSEQIVFIRVEDNGPGLPDHARADLFEPFKGSQKPGGSGLGLAISAEIIRAHYGEITLEKSDETGTVFLIRLPVGEIAKPPAAKTTESLEERLQTV
ncbi:MAG: HAMP domain-containing sensor histidine kinase [Pseudomonadota bacterium]